MTPAELRDRVVTALEALAAAAEPYGGFIPSALDRKTGRMLDTLPPPIPGQRHGDRCERGSNLMHDHVTLRAMFSVAAATGRDGLAAAAERYLDAFMAQCTGSVSGLFPWGEHAFWDLERGVAGSGPLNSDPPEPRTEGIHDHLLQAPEWLWETLLARDRQAVERFAEGLANHFVEPALSGDPSLCEYNRHAYLDRQEPFTHSDDRSCDFPRHAGFYVVDLATIWRATQNDAMRHLLETYARYSWPHRNTAGLLPFVTRQYVNRPQVYAVAQTLSLGLSMLEAAEMLHRADRSFADELREYGTTYVSGFLAAQHHPGNATVLSNVGENGGTPLTVLGSTYGDHIAAVPALHCVAAFRITGDERLLDFATRAGEAYTNVPFPMDRVVPAKDAGTVLELFADLGEVTGAEHWIDHGTAKGAEYVARYCDAALPRGAASADASLSIDYYESQHLPGYMLHGLARIALLADGIWMPADYTLR